MVSAIIFTITIGWCYGMVNSAKVPNHHKGLY